MSRQPAALPRMGSQDYYRRIFRTAEHRTLDEVTHALHALWHDYGWRSTRDVMAEWICAIDYIIPTAPAAGLRDFTGTVLTSKWAKDEFLSEERMLAMAVQTAAQRAERDGTAAHESFAYTRDIADRLRENVFAWKPVFAQALRTAHATEDRDAVRAVLGRGPGVRERDWWALRDGAAYLFQVADWPMSAARELGRPVRPPETAWIANDHSIPPNMIMSLLPPGELSGDC